MYYILCFLSMVCFATYPTLVKLVLQQNESAPLILIVGISTSIVLLLIFGVVPELKQYLKHKKQGPHLVLMGLLSGAIAPLCIGMGLAHSTVLNSVLLTSLQIPFSALLSRFVLKEKISGIYKLGLGIFLVGIVFYTTNFFQNAISFTTFDLFFIAAAVCYGLADILYKKKLSHLHFEQILLSRSLFGAFFLFIFNVIVTSSHQVAFPTSEHTLLLLAVIVFIPILVGQRLWYLALKNIPAAKASMYISLYPIFAALFGIWILHEEIMVTSLLAGGIMIVGLIIAQFHFRKHPAHSQHIHLQHFKQQ